MSVVFSKYSVSSTNKTDRHDIAKILLKVALNTIKTNKQIKGKGERVAIQSTHFCAYPKPGSGFRTSNVVVFFYVH
jgi:hypothetical protein